MPFTSEGQFVISVQQVMQVAPWAIALTVFLARWMILANVVIGVALLASDKKKHRHAVLEAAWSAVLAMVLTSLIAFLIQRARPHLGFEGVSLLIPPPFNTSFPSGHTSTAFAIAFAFAYAERLAGTAAFIVAFLVAFGRVSAGVHYPSDILGGIAVGLLSFIIVRFCHRELARRDITRSAAAHHHKP